MVCPRPGTLLRSAYVLCFLAFAGYAGTAAPPPATAALVRLERSLDAMGTTYTVAAYGTDRFAMDAAVEEAFEEVGRLNDLLSNYKPDSEWSKVNREAVSGPVRVSEELFALLERCVAYSRASDGAFDITVGPLMKLWGFYKGSGRVPHRSEIRTAQGRIGWQHIELDGQKRTVRFKRPVEMDPGGIGKGYAVDRMIGILRKRGITSGIVSAGRSSIYAIGAPPNEPRGWRVEIPNPRDPRKDAFVVYLKDESMSTSGSTEKFFRAGGRVYTHIMDPRAGAPAEGMLQVSVVAPKTIDSEAWTKPYFVNGREWAASHVQKDFRVFLCEDRTEIACVSLP
jgi:thiamine biosynthesis lipoprotein